MISRLPANAAVRRLLQLLEQRYALHLNCRSASHLREVCQHYDAKRAFIRRQLGEADALVHPDYAKAVLISETARLALREIDPWPRRKKAKQRNPQ
jgi:hypothetical protein